MEFSLKQAVRVGLIAILLASQELYSQQGDTVRGRVFVKSKGVQEPALGASVSWRNTKIGKIISSTSNGEFAIPRTPISDTLDIHYVGSKHVVIVAPADSVEIEMLPLEGVEVEVSASTTDVKDPVRSERISRRDLSKAACCSLAESFEKSPTVEVSYSDAATGARQIQLLGLRGQYTQFMVEAVPLIRSVELPYGLDHIPGPFMRSVNISKGASSVSGGHESMTGQIDVSFMEPMSTPALYVNVYGNTFSRLEANVLGSQFVTDELSTATMIHARTMPHAPDNNADGFMDMPTFTQFNGVHRWVFNNDEVEVQAWVRGLYDTYESGTVHKGDAHHDSSAYTINTDITRVDGFIKLGLLDAFESVEGSSVALVLNGGGHKQNSTLGFRSMSGIQNTFTARLLALLPFSDENKLFMGASGMYEEFAERLDLTRFARNENEFGLFTEYTASPSEDVTFITGVRYDHNNVYGGRLVPRFHARVSTGETSSLRASIGRGWRAPSVIIENMSAFVNNRTVHFDQNFRAEDSWNAGVSYTTDFEVLGRRLTLSGEFYRTEFSNQIVVDYDRSVRDVFVSNLNGKSWSNATMLQVETSLIPRLSTMLAARFVQAISPYNDQLQQRPLTSQLRLLFTASWTTPSDDWQIDGTVSWNGPGRIPATAANPVQYQMASTYPGWWRINGQVTHRIGKFEFYVGSENLTNFIQQTAVLASDAPQSQYFDGSLIWGAMDSRLAYAGVRFTIEHED